MSTSIELSTAIEKVEKVVLECGVMALRDQPAMMQAIQLAQGVKALKAIFNKEFIESTFLHLQNTPLGFLTDKPDGGYPGPVVQECLIEALLRGFRPVNNEWNIIAGRFYGAKNGYERQVHEFPGVSNVEIDLGVPKLAGEKGALVVCEGRWRCNGNKESLWCGPPRDGASTLDTSIPVKVNSGMGPDAILGKATRKLYARMYQRMSGVVLSDVEPEDVIPTEALPAPADPAKDGQRIKMGGKKTDAPPPKVSDDFDPSTGELREDPPITREPGVD